MIKLLPIALLLGTLNSTPVPVAPEPLHGDAGPAHCTVRTFCGGGSYLGIEIAEVDSAQVARLGLGEERGAVVRRVIDSTPAATAGLLTDDVIVGWNGGRVEGTMQLMRLVQETPAGRTVHLDIIRKGAPLRIDAKVGNRSGKDAEVMEEMRRFIPGGDSARSLELEMLGKELNRLGTSPSWDSLADGSGQIRIERFMAQGRPRLGVELQGLTPQLASYFGVEAGSGALIGNVIENMPAARAGFQAGDVITAIDGDKVRTAGDVTRILRKKQGEVSITVIRDKQPMTIRVTLDAQGSQSAKDRSRMQLSPEIE